MMLTMQRLPFLLGASALLLTGCPADDAPAETSGTETSTGDTGDGDGDTGDGDGDTGDGDGDSGDGDGDTGAACGDGVVDPGEECDDGNVEDGDGCSSTCTISSCGLTWSVTEPIVSSAAGAFDVVIGDDGSLYAAGVSIGADDDAWIAKWNADGTSAWSVSYDSGDGDDAAATITLGAGGELYVGGWKIVGSDQDFWYAELSAADGSVVWEVIEGGAMNVMGGDDFVTGIDVDPNGDLVLSGRIRAGDGDDDVWVRKASAADGAEIWTSTWTGVGDGNFSTDRAGECAAAPDGTIWVTAREHIAFDTQDATLLHFDADGGLVDAYQPQAGGSHSHNPVDVVATADAVYFTFDKSDFPYRGWLYKLGTDGSEQWLKTEQDWIIMIDEETTLGEDWRIRGLGLDADGNLGLTGSYVNEESGQNLSWDEAWVAKVDGAGETLCRGSHQVGPEEQIPPSLFIDAGSFNATGFGLVGIETAGQGGETQLWTGMFMP